VDAGVQCKNVLDWCEVLHLYAVVQEKVVCILVHPRVHPHARVRGKGHHFRGGFYSVGCGDLELVSNYFNFSRLGY
jgi:hypothetical protein